MDITEKNRSGGLRWIPAAGAVRNGGLALLVLATGALALSIIPRDFSLTLAQTRPYAQVAAVVLAALGLWGAGRAARDFARQPGWMAWRASARMVGWVWTAAAGGAVLLLAAQDPNAPYAMPMAGAARAVEAIVPLMMAAQAALLFSPDDEPALEVLLACPRPAAWLLLERLLVLFAVMAAAAAAGVVVCRVVDPALDVPLALTRWIPPALFLAGVGVYTTLRSRVAAFGTTTAALVWFVFAFFGAGLLPGMPTFWPLTVVQPFVWSFNPYLQPDALPSEYYLLNRIIVAGAGIALLVAAARWLRDEERVLGGGKKQKTQA